MKQIEKYKGLLDMIDGGGAGKVGDKFQGGGLLSILANALATPYGSEDRAKEELAAGLLGKTRPVMRPNRPAPSAPPALISAGSAPAPGYTLPGTLAEMSDLARNRAMPLTKTSDIPGGFNPASAAPVQPDPFSYSGDREAGMAGNVPTPGRYDYGLPDDANDFGINPNVAPNPFAGNPGVGGGGRSLDGQILRNAPAGLPNAPLQDAAPSELQFRSFVQHISEKYPNRVDEILSSPSISNIINHYLKNGVLPVVGSTP